MFRVNRTRTTRRAGSLSSYFGRESHTRICHSSKELGLLLAELGGADRVEGNILERRCVLFEDLVLLPLLLVLLLDSNKGITLVSLRNILLVACGGVNESAYAQK